jgi:hypothetical protein
VEQGAGVCGQLLAGAHGLCLHPLTCDVAAARLRPHRAVATALGRALRACGAAVDYERHVPHLYQWDPGSQRYVEAILDVVTSWPGGSSLRAWDVVISCPHSSRARRPDERPAAAAEGGEHVKIARYGDGVTTLALESYGRLGPRSQDALQLVAREAVLYGTAVIPPGLLQRRWRQDIDLALAFAQADAVLAARVALPRVAGPSFPISRVLRRRTVAAGERRELLAAPG